MSRDVAAQRMADSLFEFERALDLALARGAESIATAATTRAELGLGIKCGASAISKLAAVLETLAGAREGVGGAHDEFAVLSRALRLRPNMIGGGDKGPNDEALPVSALRQVA